MCRDLERVRPGFVEDFIGIGVADARNQPSPCQHALHFTVKWFQAKLEIVERKWLVNHIGPLVFKSDNFAALTGREIVDLPHFFWSKYLRCMPDFISKMRTGDAATLADALHHINPPVSIGLMINSRSPARPIISSLPRLSSDSIRLSAMSAPKVESTFGSKAHHVAQHKRFSFCGTGDFVTDEPRQQVFPDYYKIGSFGHRRPIFN